MLVSGYDKLPLSFEANQGQVDPQVRFTTNGKGYSLFLTDTEAVLALSKEPVRGPRTIVGKASRAKEDRQPEVVRLQLSGANPNLRVAGASQLPGTANYFIGNDPSKWQHKVPTYAKVKYANVYDGVDLIYYGNQRQLEYDFVVAPNADLKPIRLHFAGASRLKLDSNGDLEVIARNGQLAFHKPVLYQTIDDRRQSIDGAFRLLARNTITFVVGAYDHSKPLVIDPTLVYSTYLGGSGIQGRAGVFPGDIGTAITIDINGNTYVTGQTFSTEFPVTHVGYQTTSHDPLLGQAFVTKFNAAGTALEYSTYLGGSGDSFYGDAGLGIAVDSFGDAYVTGFTNSIDFPVSKNAYQHRDSAIHSTLVASAAFVAKLNPQGNELIYSTFLSGTGVEWLAGAAPYGMGDQGQGIAVNSHGEAFVIGTAASTNFPTTQGAFQDHNKSVKSIAGTNVFVTKLNRDASDLIYSTYLGGSGNSCYQCQAGDIGAAIAIDDSNEGLAYITGSTFSQNFPVTRDAFRKKNLAFNENAGLAMSPAPNAFITKLNATGSALEYSTFLGGSVSDAGTGIAVDGSGYAYVTGTSYSKNFPVTQGAFQEFNKGASKSLSNAFVTKLNPTGSELVYSTYLGGSGNSHYLGDIGAGIAIDSSGNAFVAGTTGSWNFPITSDAYQQTNKGKSGGNAFLTEFDPEGSQLVYSSFLGGAGSDTVYAIAIDLLGNAYVTGTTSSEHFPITTGAIQPRIHSEQDAFVAEFGIGAPYAPAVSTTSVTSPENPQSYGGTVTFLAQAKDPLGDTLSIGTVTFTIDGKTQVTVAINGNNGDMASYQTTALTVGAHTITATYNGSLLDLPSSASYTQTITP